MFVAPTFRLRNLIGADFKNEPVTLQRSMNHSRLPVTRDAISFVGV
jgi:hypothetical protein